MASLHLIRDCRIEYDIIPQERRQSGGIEYHGGRVVEMQILVRQRVPSRHGRENVPDRSDERPSTDEHDDHRLYVNVLQVRNEFLR